jgi:hypothetical protein
MSTRIERTKDWLEDAADATAKLGTLIFMVCCCVVFIAVSLGIVGGVVAAFVPGDQIPSFGSAGNGD